MSKHPRYRVGDRVWHARRGPGVVTDDGRQREAEERWPTVHYDSGEKMIVPPDHLTPEPAPAPEMEKHPRHEAREALRRQQSTENRHFDDFDCGWDAGVAWARGGLGEPAPDPAPDTAPASEFERPPETFGEALQLVRTHRGVSQEAMAEVLGWHRVSYTKFENGTRTPGAVTIGHLWRNRFLSPEERKVLVSAAQKPTAGQREAGTP